MMDVSVIIVSRDTREILRGCLRSVYAETRGVDFEVIVVDNASTDGSAGMVRGEFPRAPLVANGENRGFAAANNQGMRLARGRYVLLLNSDTVVLEGAIQKTVSFADAHREAAVVGCRVLDADRTLQPTCFMFPGLLNLALSTTYLYKLFPRNRFLGREGMAWWDRSDVREVEVVTGCFMLVRREAIDAVGVMDERFFMFAEETDWCYRFARKGWKSLFFPGARIIHIGGQSSKASANEMDLMLRQSILAFFDKHRSPAAAWIARVMLSLFYAVRAPAWGILSVTQRGQARRAARARFRLCVRGACGLAAGSIRREAVKRS